MNDTRICSECRLDAACDELPAYLALSFDQVPAACHVRIFGVDYVQLVMPDGGRLFLTRFGWPRLAHLLPQRWYEQKRYLKQGSRLPGATSNVYRVTSYDDEGRPLQVVVKFCRFAQDVPLSVRSTIAPAIGDDEVLDAARFNGPFEEFGLLMDLRRGRYGPPELCILTKRPLAIYCPPEQYSQWQLGRNPARFARHQHDLDRDQGRAGRRVELDSSRLYILLFGWVEGRSAEEFYEEGLITQEEMRALSMRVADELHQKGFTVLDNKPKHFILRRRADGSLLRRDGKLVYLLVDFELLRRTEEYEAFLLGRRPAEPMEEAEAG